MVKKIIILLSLILILTIPISSNAAEVNPAENKAENVIGIKQPSSAVAYYQYATNAGENGGYEEYQGEKMYPEGYYSAYQWYIPVASWKPNSYTYYTFLYKDGIYFLEDQIYKFDIIVDNAFGLDYKNHNANYFRLAFYVDNENVSSSAHNINSISPLIKPSKIEVIGDSFYRLTFAIDFSVKEDWTDLISVTHNGRKYYKIDGLTIVDQYYKNYNSWGQINLQVRMYLQQASCSTISKEEYIAYKQNDDLIEKEKEEANETGNELIEDMMQGIPNETGGFLTAIKKLTNVISYNQTQAKINIPALTIPKIGNFVPETTLMEEQELNFKQFFDLIPNTIMLLIQSFVTASLVIYAIKSIYGEVQYAISLKGSDAE